jgi:uracil phosphoribosyltransferase
VPLIVLDHPIAQDKLLALRDETTPPHVFAALMEDISQMLFLAASEELSTRAGSVKTPMGRAKGRRLTPNSVVLIPILRAGLGMVRGISRLVPDVSVHHLGIYRDEETLQPVHYYRNLPHTLKRRHAFVLDPMLATAGSAVDAVRAIVKLRPKSVSFLCVLAARAGADRLCDAFPDLPVYAAACDEVLNNVGYIVPGLGDAGDRLFGTTP